MLTTPESANITTGYTAEAPQRVLVTGGAGFIGGNLVRRLLHFGYHVRVLDNFSQQDTISDLVEEEGDRLEIVRGDITDLDTCKRAVGKPGEVAIVFHLAAMSKVLPSLGDVGFVKYCAEQNVIGTINILTAVKAAQDEDGKTARVVYAASSTAYDCSATPTQREDGPIAPITPYALSKQIGEQYGRLMSDMYGLSVVCLRFFMVYGPRQPSSGAYAIVTGVFEKAVAEGKDITIHGDGLQSRDFVHVHDVADACIRAAKYDMKGEAFDLINVGTGVSTTILDLARRVQPDETKRVHGPSREFDLRQTLCDTTRMHQRLSYVAHRHAIPSSMPGSSFSLSSPELTAQIVVCRFNENLSWTDRWADQRVVYNKGADDLPFTSVALKNVGRDSDCYMQHIVRMYPHFPDVTIFTQGTVVPHRDVSQFSQQVDEIIQGKHDIMTKGYIPLSKHFNTISNLQDRYAMSLPMREIWDEIFTTDPTDGKFECNYNGLFAVTRSRLLRHTKGVYEKLLALQHEKDPVGYVNERLWMPLFSDLTIQSRPL